MSGTLNAAVLESSNESLRPIDPAKPRRRRYRPSKWWKLQRFLIASSKNHAFLDRFWAPWLFAFVPRAKRRDFALHLLSFSPHYWIYQWSDKYSPDSSREEILEGECRRNADSRRVLCEKLLTRYVKPQMTVLDFGCGPGFLARCTSEHVAQVIASDVSRGVVACAQHLNPAPNLKYVANGVADLRVVENEKVDLVYTFAVFQHLQKTQAAAFLAEFARVLKPGGMGVVHTIFKPAEEAREYDPKGWVEKRVMLRMVFYTEQELRSMIQDAGFDDIEVNLVSSLVDIDDDIGQENLVTFRKKKVA